VETEERDERGSGRSQNVVHTLPRSMASVPQFLTGPLVRKEPRRFWSSQPMPKPPLRWPRQFSG
jgi:hypothetical protein